MTGAATLLAGALALAAPVAAGAAAITLTPESPKVEAGLTFAILGTAQLPPGARLEGDPEPREDARFSVLAVQVRDALADDGGASLQSLRLEVMGFAVGKAVFPPLSWTVRLPDGSTTTLRSPPVPIELEAPAAADPAADIAGIRGPIRPFDARPWLIGAAALLLAFSAWRWWRDRRAAERIPPPLPPHLEALRRLGALEASGLWAQGRLKEFYAELADILRVYLEGRFAVPAPRQVTSGTLRRMITLGVDRGVVAAAREVLESADLAKFARWTPDEKHRDLSLSRARAVVEETAPRPEPEAAGEPAGTTAA